MYIGDKKFKQKMKMLYVSQKQFFQVKNQLNINGFLPNIIKLQQNNFQVKFKMEACYSEIILILHFIGGYLVYHLIFCKKYKNYLRVICNQLYLRFQILILKVIYYLCTPGLLSIAFLINTISLSLNSAKHLVVQIVRYLNLYKLYQIH